MNKVISIEMYKGFFVAIPHSKMLADWLDNFDHGYEQRVATYDYKKRTYKHTRKALYAGGNRNFREYRYIRAGWDSFVWHLKDYGVKKEEIEYKEVRPPKATKLNAKVMPQWKDRPWQPQYIRSLTAKDDRFAKLVDLQTGKGKGYISIKSLSILNLAVLIIVRPRYMQKWVDELSSILDINEEEIDVVTGADGINKLARKCKFEKYRPRLTVISNRTFANFITEYEAVEDEDEWDYEIVPQDITNVMKYGIVLIDEAHEEFYSVFKASLYVNVSFHIALSATMDSDDALIRRMQHLLYPNESRLSFLDYHPYSSVVAVRYRLRAPKRIKPMRRMGYSHIKFEQDIMRNSHTLKSYIDMIDHFLKKGYFDRRLTGEKALIFAQTVDMCTYIYHALKERYPDVNIQRYTGEDDFSNLKEGDVTVSTPLSSGTAVDIPGLLTVIQTVSVKSRVANIQHFGRLREIKGRDTRFYYFYTFDVPSQIKYHRVRTELFSRRAKYMSKDEYHKPV